MLERENCDANYGRSIALTAGNTATVVKNEGACEGAELVTVALSAVPLLPLPIAGFKFRARASILFGVGGHAFEVVCDYAHGCQLTVAASAIRVDAHYVSDGGLLTPVPMRFGAALAYGTRPATGGSTPRLTTEAETIVSGSVGALTLIPAFATHVSAWSDIGNGTAEIQLISGDGATVIAVAVLGPGESLSIPCDAAFAAVKNVGRVNGNFRLCFGLAV